MCHERSYRYVEQKLVLESRQLRFMQHTDHYAYWSRQIFELTFLRSLALEWPLLTKNAEVNRFPLRFVMPFVLDYSRLQVVGVQSETGGRRVPIQVWLLHASSSFGPACG